MKCMNCGAELLPQAKFCTKCGTPVPQTSVEEVKQEMSNENTNATSDEASVAQDTTEVEETAPAPETAPAAEETEAVEVENTPENTDAQEEISAPETTSVTEETEASEVAAPVPAPRPVPQMQSVSPASQETPKKKGKAGVIAVVCVFAAVFVAVLVGVFMLITSLVGKGNTGDNQIYYVKGNKLYFSKNMTKEDEESYEICKIKAESDYYIQQYMCMELSHDGKYLYFLNDIDVMSGDLYRVPVEELSKDEDNNEELVEKIDKNVSSYTILDNDQVFYCVKGEIYLFDGTDSEKISNYVEWYSLMENQSGVTYIYNKDGNRQLKNYTFSNKEESQITDKIGDQWMDIADTAAFCYKDDFCNPVYNSENEYNDAAYAEEEEPDEVQEEEFVYVDGDNQETTVVKGNFGILDTNVKTGTAYYTKYETVDIPLYDFVDDPYAEADAAIADVNFSDYLVPVTEEQVFDLDTLNYWAEYPEEKNYFLSSLYYVEEYGMYYYYNWELSGDFYYNEVDGQWYQLDTTSYNTAIDAVYEVQNRKDFRQELQENTVSYFKASLYRWTKEQGETLIAEDVNSSYSYVNARNSVACYIKQAEETSKIAWDEAYDIWNVESFAQDQLNSYYSYDEGYPYTIAIGDNSGESVTLSGSIFDMGVSSDGKSMYICSSKYDEDTGEASYQTKYFELSDGAFVEGDSKDVYTMLYRTNDDHQYLCETKNANENPEYDLYSFDSGDCKLLAKDIAAAEFGVFTDGNILTLSDLEDSGIGSLKYWNAEGEDTKIAKSVSKASFINEDKIVYIKDGKLYVYLGEDKEIKIAGDVLTYECSYPECNGFGIFYEW